MNEEAQRIAIVEACPTIFHRWQGTPGKGGFSYEYLDGNGWHQCLDDNPLHDLNAMHKAIATLSKEQQWDFAMELKYKVLSVDHDYDGITNLGVMDIMNAPCEKLAETFLRAIEKWDESE